MPGATPYVLVEERSVGGGSQSKGKQIFRMILSIYTLVLSALLFADGILSLIASHSNPYTAGIEYYFPRGVGFYSHTANFTIRVFSAYLMIISLLFICVELKSTTILTAFAGMISPLGRGIIYFITGLCVFGLVGNWGIFFGVFWMICGLAHIIIGIPNCKNFYEEGSVDNGSAVVTRTVEETSTYESASSEKNFCRSCGAALSPSDKYCPDCSAAV